MPMRNARPFVVEALGSVLAEKRVPIEMIVVDDGSTDGSRSAVDSVGDKRIRLVEGPRNGIAEAFNAGLAASRGAIVMRCDADDVYPPERIPQQVAWLQANREFGAICGAFAAMNARGGSRLPFDMPSEPGEISDELRSGVTRTHFCTFAVRSGVLREIGGARSFFVVGEDLDLQLRLGESCRVWYAPELAYVYRLHDASITHSMRTPEREFYEQQARSFQIQRQRFGVDDLERGAPPEFISDDKARAGSASKHMQDVLIAGTWSAYRDGRRVLALRNAAHAALAQPKSWAGWRNLLVLVLKLPLPAGAGKSGSKPTR